RLHDHVPARAIANARLLERVPAATGITLAFSLPLRNQQELEELLRRLYDPADPLYGHYLTPGEFTDRFGPSEADYDALAAYARGLGLTITGTHSNRALLDVSGPAAVIEAAFNLRLLTYQAPDGRKFYAPDNDPQVPASIAARIAGVIGLDNAAVWHSHNRFVTTAELAQSSPYQIGTGPGNGLSPGDIRTAYNMNGIAASGSGQTLGLFELDGYNAADVTGYESYFGLPAVPLQNVLIDGFSGRAGTGADEVTLDIELQAALAPGAAKIIVYEGPNSNTGVVDTYHRIATDNLAKQISTSWGLSEGQSSAAVISSENSAFQQMAAQGQSIYAASGDSGAYDNGSTLSVDDPASQPYMVGVGGTQLFVNSGESYNYETTWNNGTVSSGAGGGGVSSIWSIPSWQQGVTGAASATMRNVPDVSLNADQYTGYAIYYKGGWWIYGGTSCGAPLWAAYTARVNQQRLANGMTTLGFANPVLYQIATGTGYGTDFHDIADGSTNLYYKAATGYDNATGWGSFNGAGLFADLAPSTPPTSPPATPTGLTATAGNGTVTLNWTASAGATSYKVYRGTTPGGETSLVTGITATTYTDATTNGVTYYYQVAATNSLGDSALSSEVSATPSAPVLAITAGPTATANKTFAQIQWTTNLAASSVVRYGTSAGSLTGTVSNSTPVTAHSLKISSLARHTTYYYQVSSTAGGATVSSTIKSFTTQ
ncbi:MAG TPA: protease pro-enzyme activation domain-containing protein, partial [Desulfuromonadaceae bacterium]